MGTPDKANSPVTDEVENKRYFIDEGWFGQHRRSLPLVLRSRLCESCQDKHIGDDRLADTIKRCCSQTEGFVSAGQPFEESAFRLLLARGGQPMSLGEMLSELKERSDIGLLSMSAKSLDRLLSRDTFYGIRPVAESIAAEPTTKP